LLKKETRILGLSGTTIDHRTILVGVVFRGALWLDGVVTSSLDRTEQEYELQISRAIQSSKQYSQLHAVIVSRRLSRNRKISFRDLSVRLRLPVIALGQSNYRSRTGRLRPLKSFGIVVSGKHLRVSAVGIDRAGAERLCKIGCTLGSTVPESVRVADLVAEQLGRVFLNRQQNREPR
jgi:endonuclease V-like protein UPF0215 family